MWCVISFLTRIGTQFTQSTTELTPSKGRKLFKPWLKKYTWMVYNRDEGFMYCKICTKPLQGVEGIDKESQDRNFQNTVLCQHASP